MNKHPPTPINGDDSSMVYCQPLNSTAEGGVWRALVLCLLFGGVTV